MNPTLSDITLTDLRLEIPLDAQILPPFDVLNYQTLFVGQVQETDEAVRRGNVVELLFGVDVREVVHDVREHERAGLVGGEGGDLRFLR